MRDEYTRGFGNGWNAAVSYLQEEVPGVFDGDCDPSLYEQAAEQRDRIVETLSPKSAHVDGVLCHATTPKVDGNITAGVHLCELEPGHDGPHRCDVCGCEWDER